MGCVDHQTKLVKFIQTKTTITTQELAYNLFQFYMLPMDIVSDIDSKFMGDF